MKIIKQFALVVCSLYLFSCGTQRKAVPNYNYLQNVSDSAVNKPIAVQDLIIQAYDNLSIQVFSASSRPEADLLFNPPALAGANVAGGGYLVSREGNIEFPRLGTIKAAGFTKQQLSDLIKEKIVTGNYLSEPVVIIRFLNYKVTVLGEVTQQGVYNIPGERVTILEAIGLAGGVTLDGKKTTVKVMREVNGKRETGMVDLTENKLFESPYYYLQQNDVVTVEMSKRKSRQTEQQNTIQKVGLVASIVTAVVLIYNTFGN